MAIQISGIYLIRNTINNKLYVGQSVNIIDRWRHHKWHLKNNKHANIHLQRAWNIDTEQSFEFSILYTCEPTQELLCEAEQYFMTLLTPEYNFCPVAGSTAGVSPSEETRRKISEATKGKPKSEETKQRMKENWKNNKEKLLAARKPITEETKQKMSEAHSGENHHFYGITGEANPNFGKKRSDEFSERMSKLHKGETKSKEHRQKISNTLKGVPLSEERKQAMRVPKPKQSPEQIAKRVAATKATKEAKAKLNKSPTNRDE